MEIIETTEKQDLFEAEFTIKFIVYENSNNYVIAKAKDLKTTAEIKDTKSQITVKGVFPRIDSGSTFKGNCKWTFDPKYGYALETYCPILTLPSNIFGIKHFLLKNVKGVGEKTVDKIINAYGEASLDRIKQGGLDGIKGIPEKIRERIYNKVMESQVLEELSVYLFKHGVTNYNDVVEIYNEFGNDAMDMIISNPYSISRTTLSRFPLSDRIALSSGFDINSSERKQRIILYYITTNMFSSGNLYEKESDIIDNLQNFMSHHGITPFTYTGKDLSDEITSLEKSGQLTIDTSLNSSERLLYLPWVYKKEVNTAELISSMLTAYKGYDESSDGESIFDITGFLRKYELQTGIILDDVQKKAVKNAINLNFSVLTGGPGTGKTLTINAIIQCIMHYNPDARIVLCAPSGRAAKRMSEMTGLPAFTIHRLLGLSVNWEQDMQKKELEADYVIVDESSMIDHNLFHILLKAVSEAEASILFVGDKDQLPPVGAGMPFRDLIESGSVPVVRLEHLHRQAENSQININAKAINSGITEIGRNGLQFDLKKQDFFFFPASSPEEIIDKTRRTINALAKSGVAPDNITVLTPMRKTDIGVRALNTKIQEHLNPPSEEKPEILSGSTTFRLGDRVMQITNNYNRAWKVIEEELGLIIEEGLGVFNGDIGRITAIDGENETVTVGFDDFRIVCGKLVPETKTVSYDYKSLSELSLAYSITVHKAQGSEYPIVIMPLSPLHLNLSRAILYTSVSRAREKFIFIGDLESLLSGIQKVDERKRNTGLRERLRGGRNIIFPVSKNVKNTSISSAC